MRIRKILVPVDFSDGSRAAVDEAIALAESVYGNVEVGLLHVWDDGEKLLPEMTLRTDARGTATRLLAESRAHGSSLQRAASFLGQLEEDGIGVEATMRHGPVAETIVEMALNEGYDLVVMGTHGRTGVRHAMLGSVAEKVVRESPIPVLTVRMPVAVTESATVF